MISRRWLIFFISASLFFLSQLYRTSNAVIAPHLLQDLALDTKGLGLLSASFFYAFAITQIPISMLLDKVGARLMMTILSMVGVSGAILFSMADSLGLGLGGRILLGIGMACNLMGTLKLLTAWFSPMVFATVSGMVISIGTIGNMVSATPLVALVDHTGWRAGFQLIAGVNLILAVAFYVIVRDQPSERPLHDGVAAATINTRNAICNLQTILRQKNFWIISFSTFVRYGVYAAVQALWAGPFLMEVMQYSTVKTGNLILLMNVGFIAGAPFWGALSDRVLKTRKWIVIFGTAVFASITVSFAVVPPDVNLLVMVSVFFAYGFMASTGQLMYPHIKELMPLEMAGAAMTAINFFTMLGPAIFLQGLGILMQALFPLNPRSPAAFDTAFLLCTGCLVVVAFFYLFTKEGTIK